LLCAVLTLIFLILLIADFVFGIVSPPSNNSKYNEDQKWAIALALQQIYDVIALILRPQINIIAQSLIKTQVYSCGHNAARCYDSMKICFWQEFFNTGKCLFIAGTKNHYIPFRFENLSDAELE